MRIRYLGFVALALMATAGCSAAGSASAVSGVVSGRPVPRVAGPVPSPITVEGMDTPTLGVVLADLQGMTLYRFTKESSRKIACLGACLKTWTPLRVKPGTAPRRLTDQGQARTRNPSRRDPAADLRRLAVVYLHGRPATVRHVGKRQERGMVRHHGPIESSLGEPGAQWPWFCGIGKFR